MSELPNRSRKILFAAVTEFISTGEPVGSRTLAKRYGLDLSPASIRNVLADLEEAGFLKQPHTSAGRIPTDRALRVFIDTLVELRAVTPEDQAKMGERFTEIYAVADDPLRETGKYLSELSGAAAVVTSPRAEVRTLAQLRFIRTKPGQLLAVLVFSDGTVENRFLTIENGMTDSELVKVHNLLADVIEGRTLAEVRELFAKRLADDRLEIDSLRRRAFELANAAMETVAKKSSDVVIEGRAKLMSLPDYSDVERLKRLMSALEEREVLVRLLDRTISTHAVTVIVGSEAEELGGSDLSLVVAPYLERGKVAGAVGVIGPTRMDYAKVMPLVDATANAMSRAMGKGERGSG